MFVFFFNLESGDYQRVVAFLKGIPQNVLAKAALRSKAYTRALMHFEGYILENKENIQDHLTFLQVIKVGFVIIFLAVCQQKPSTKEYGH